MTARRLPLILSLVAVALVAFGWWNTAISTADARIAAVQTIEPYAFAVHEQLLANFSRTGHFAQVIHRGYDDTWAWSGHRALTLYLTGWLYGLAPGAGWLARIMIAGALLGVVPAFALGRRAFRSDVGGLVGALLYLGSPVILVLALQDYQDLVFAVPALLFAAWAAASGRWWAVALGTLLAVAPREECVPLAAAMVWVVPPDPRPDEAARRRWLRWLQNGALASVVAGAYAVWLHVAWPVSGAGYHMPLASALSGLATQSDRIFLDGWPYLGRFYALLLVPVGVFALLDPLAALPALGLVALHLTVPDGHGVDRSWGGHAHHLAPAVPFIFVATLRGAARLARRLGRGRWVLISALLVAAVVQWPRHARAQNLVVTPTWRAPAWWSPAWRLALSLPDDAVPAVPKAVSLVVADRLRAYTYDDSLDGKAGAQGLGACTHLLADQRQAGVVAWGMSMPGAQVLDKDGPYVLIGWTPGAADPTWRPGTRFPHPPAWLGPYHRRGDIPGVAPFQSRQRGALPPAIRLPWR